VSPDGCRAISASGDRTLKVWDVKSGRALQTLESRSNSLSAPVLSPDGRRAFSASGENTLRVWDLESGRMLQILEDHSSFVNA